MGQRETVFLSGRQVRKVPRENPSVSLKIFHLEGFLFSEGIMDFLCRFMEPPLGLPDSSLKRRSDLMSPEVHEPFLGNGLSFLELSVRPGFSPQGRNKKAKGRK